MALSLTRRSVGEIVIAACAGRIIEGAESAALQQEIVSVLRDYPYVVLDLARVEFIDSGGLGQLVRLLSRARGAGGDLKLCAVPPRVQEILRITRLGGVFDIHPSESEAIAAFYRPTAAAESSHAPGGEILCVSSSADVLAYASAILRQAGFGVMASAHLPDALTLLRASKPKAIVIDAALHGTRATWTAGTFSDLAIALPVIDLPEGFSAADAGDAGEHLLDRVRSAIGARPSGS